jgi:hypothetical protein
LYFFFYLVSDGSLEGIMRADRYTFFLAMADVMIFISLLAIAGTILLMINASSSGGNAQMPGIGYLARGMIYIWGMGIIFINLLFITIGAIAHACAETARNTRATRALASGATAARIPA